MYQTFYKLKENPFNVTADPEFFFSSQGHLEAITHLVYGIEQRKGILVITGEVGTGKTTLCRKLIHQAHKKIKICNIFNPNLTELEFLTIVCRDFGIRTKWKDKIGLMRSLHRFLIKANKKNVTVVLIIDEAQHLTIEQLEQIRLLTNFETEKEKLLQIILVGQPELNEKLQLTELRQLRQRIAVHYQIKPLEKHDINNYINHRLKKAMINPEYLGSVSFTDSAIESIYHFTKGSPRTINILCDRALLAGFITETRFINEAIIANCAKEVMYCEHHLSST